MARLLTAIDCQESVSKALSFGSDARVSRSKKSDPQIQSDPEGGIPSGSLEVLGRSEFDDYGFNRGIFPGDVVNCFICFTTSLIDFMPPGCRRQRISAVRRAACGHRTSGF